MNYSQVVNIEKNRVFIIIPQDIWYIERFARMEPRLYSYAFATLPKLSGPLILADIL